MTHGIRHLGRLAALALLVCAAAAAAADPVADLIAAAPGPDAYPDADAVVLQRTVTLGIDEAGRLTRREHVVTRLQTQWAMRRLSDERVAWDAARQDLEVHTCRTFMTDGTVVPSPDNAFNEVTPDAVNRAVPFLDIREMVISHVGTEVGCVLDLDYSVTDREPGPLPAWSEVFLQGRWPVREVTVRVEPAELLAAVWRAEGLENVADLGPGARDWTYRDLPALPAEGAGAHRGDFTPHVVVTTARDWNAVAAHLRAARNAASRVGPELRAWLADVQTGDEAALTPLATVERIAQVAHDGVRTIHLPTGMWSRAPRTAEEVYASAVATPWEQALLAYALLEAAGFAPEIGFFSRWSEPDTDLPAAGHFGEVRVVVPVDGENWWLAPERAEPWRGRCDLAGRWSLFLDRHNSHRVYTTRARDGLCRLSARVRPADEGGGLIAEADVVVRGVLREGAGDAQSLAAAVAGRLLQDGEATSVETRVEGPDEIHVRVAAAGPALAAPTGDLVVYPVPYPTGSVLAHLPAGFDAEAPSRTAPLFGEADLREEFELVVELPAGLVPDALPATQSLVANLGSYALEAERAEGGLRITRTLALQAGRCDPADYPALRSLLAAALRQDAQPVVLVTE